MRVRMLTLAAGADGVLRPGDEVEVSPEKAAVWIEGGYAEAVADRARSGDPSTSSGQALRPADTEGREVAAVEAPEREVVPAAKVKKRRRNKGGRDV